MPFNFGWIELVLILVIVAMLFGVGKLPEVFGAVGKGIREFRKETSPEDAAKAATKKAAEQSAAEMDDTLEKSS